MNQDELNEIGTLLHIVESISQNHPKFQAISNACNARLLDINQGLIDAAGEEAEAKKQVEAERQAAEYEPDEEPLDENDPDYITPKPADKVERRI